LREEEPEEEGGSIAPRTVAEATRSLSALLTAGLPLARALETTRDVAGGPLGEVWDEVLREVRRGVSLAEALAGHPRAFTPLYVGVVRAGERSGRLAAVTDRLAGELERQEELRQRLVSASIYPVALATLAVASLLLLLLFVIPRFSLLLSDAGAELPWLTRQLVGASALVRGQGLLLLAGLAAGLLSTLAFVGSGPGQRRIAALALDLPVVGPVRRALLAGRFARLLGVLLEGGAPLVGALDDTAASLSDPAAAREVRRIREEVRSGASLHRSVSQGGVFPPELTRLIAVGEESGRLAQFLDRAADLLERRSVRAVERWVTLLEPTIIVVFGGMVAFVALGLLQAIYGVNVGGGLP